MVLKAALGPNKRSEELGRMVQVWCSPVVPEPWRRSLCFLSLHLANCTFSGARGREMSVFSASLLLFVLPMLEIPLLLFLLGPTCPPVDFLFHVCLTPSSSMLRLSYFRKQNQNPPLASYFSPATSLLLLLAKPVGDLAICNVYFSHWPRDVYRENACPTAGWPALPDC